MFHQVKCICKVCGEKFTSIQTARGTHGGNVYVRRTPSNRQPTNCTLCRNKASKARMDKKMSLKSWQSGTVKKP